MTLRPGQWEAFKAFLLIEKKFSDKARSFYTSKSRFLILAKYFNGQEWSRTLFNNFIADRYAFVAAPLNPAGRDPSDHRIRFDIRSHNGACRHD